MMRRNGERELSTYNSSLIIPRYKFDYFLKFSATVKILQKSLIKYRKHLIEK